MSKKARRRRMIEAVIETVIYVAIGMGAILAPFYLVGGVILALGL